MALQKICDYADIGFMVDNNGKLKEDVKFSSRTGFGRYFEESKINTNQGADFGPVFKKVLELYKMYE